MFIRPQGTVRGSLRSLERITTTHVLRYYQVKLPLQKSVQFYGEAEIDQYNKIINEFIKEQNQLIKHLRAFRKNVNDLVPMKEQELLYYNKFVGFLSNYEEAADKVVEVLPNSKGMDPFRIVTSKNGASMKGRIEMLGKQLKNSFMHIRNWIKLEMMNMETLVLAIHEKDLCYQRKHKAMKMLHEQQKLLKKIDEGKFTFKTMLKSKSSKDQYKLDLLQSI